MTRKKYLKRLATLQEGLFPEALSDEVACATFDCLQTMITAFERLYLSQLMRRQRSKQILYDPEHPWRTPPF